MTSYLSCFIWVNIISIEFNHFVKIYGILIINFNNVNNNFIRGSHLNYNHIIIQKVAQIQVVQIVLYFMDYGHFETTVVGTAVEYSYL